jgi:pentose-5-phosphate-3-epimerase
MNVYPSILTDSVAEVERELGLLNSVADQLAAVQVDIIDGEFTDNLTISPIDLIGIHFGDIPVDFHLMVVDPVNFVYECKQIENARVVIGQIERMHSQADFITECKEFSLKPGLSLDLYTPVESIDAESW